MNGAVGGTRTDQHRRNEANHEDPATIYGRLLARIEGAKLTHGIRSGEGAIYNIPAGVTVKAVKYRETGYDTTFAGSFECNDNDYNILWKKAARTAYICMREHFYDCPDRERVGFWGDGTPELNQCFYVFAAAAHRLCKKLVLDRLAQTGTNATNHWSIYELDVYRERKL